MSPGRGTRARQPLPYGAGAAQMTGAVFLALSSGAAGGFADTKSAQSLRKRIYRVDKFKVPDPARDEFVRKVRETHEFLHTLPGFVEDFVLEQTGGPGAFNFVTVAVWDSADAIDSARKAMMARQKASGFDPQATFSRLGIEADLAIYREIAA